MVRCAFWPAAATCSASDPTDGVGTAARFQHPLGLALSPDGKTLFVADTFNNLIRQVGVDSGKVSQFARDREIRSGHGRIVGLFEPGGLSIAGDDLYVADTNHHRILRLTIAKSSQAKVLDIKR